MLRKSVKIHIESERVQPQTAFIHHPLLGDVVGRGRMHQETAASNLQMCPLENTLHSAPIKDVTLKQSFITQNLWVGSSEKIYPWISRTKRMHEL